MNKLVTAQTLLFVTSIQIGIFMGALYDLIRIFRKLIKHPNLFVQIEDMLYWVFCSFMSFYLLYICNYAEIRPFVFIGIILGAVFYFLTFSIIFMKIATQVVLYIRKLVKITIHFLMLPIKWFLKLLGYPLRWVKLWCGHMLLLLELRYRRWRRIKYEQDMDKKVDKYLKDRRT